MEIVTKQKTKLDKAHSKVQCCQLINPDDWDEKVFKFKGKLFAKVTTRSFLYLPLNMSQVLNEAGEKIDVMNARAQDGITLSDESSPWHADHYISVTRNIPGLEMTRISGTFITKVFEGPYKKTLDWRDQIIEYVEDEGGSGQHTYFFYTTCPSCAKYYGKNYVVGFEKVA